MRAWLEDSGSFMQRLAQHGIHDAKVSVLHEDWGIARPDEAVLLSLNPKETALIREVLIHSDQHCWMFARSVFPRTTLTGEQKAFEHLGNRPLGSLLFSDPTLKRSPFTITHLASDAPQHEQISRLLKKKLPHLWCRRSTLWVHDKPLLLTEVFLPDLCYS